jgi:hypothetical protein
LDTAAIPRSGIAKIADELFRFSLGAATVFLLLAYCPSNLAVVFNADLLRERGVLQPDGRKDGGRGGATGGLERGAARPEPAQAASDIVKRCVVHDFPPLRTGSRHGLTAHPIPGGQCIGTSPTRRCTLDNRTNTPIGFRCQLVSESHRGRVWHAGAAMLHRSREGSSAAEMPRLGEVMSGSARSAKNATTSVGLSSFAAL